jgi:hypothetical protein
MWTRKLPLAALVLLSACTTITEDLPQPTSPTHGSPSPLPVVVVPIPVPSPEAPSNPAPGASPSATPGQPSQPSQPSTPPTTQGCSLPAGSGSGNNCPRESPSFLSQVESAMDQLVREEPGLFDLRRTRGCDNCYFIVNADRYVQRVAQLMSQRGLCGHYDGEELAVKSDNSFNDQYDIFTSDGYMRRQLGSYRSTCYPAWF